MGRYKESWPPSYSRYSDKIDSEEKFEKIVNQFNKADNDGSRYLDTRELDYLFKNLGCPKSRTQLRDVVTKYDINKDGKIEFSEFIEMAKDNLFYRWPPVWEDYKDEIKDEDRFIEIFAAFKMFDIDNSASIGRTELQKALSKMGHAHDANTVRIMHEFVDIDKDGEIQFNEFIKLVEIEDSEEMNSEVAIEQRKKDAFTMMCSENRDVITKSDLKKFSKKVFPAALDDNELELIMKIVANGKDEITYEDAKENMFNIIEN